MAAKRANSAPPPGSPAAAAAAGQPTTEQGDYLTTSQGVRLPDTDHSLKAGPRGPTLLEDFHLREKITHFDHERIPERVVHARGSAAHGVFRAYGNAGAVTRAPFLAEEGLVTPVFVRFSTVLGSRGSADTVRDVRGFATKFYTSEGNFDLVGNNMPVFFIQDGIKFPDIIHAGKPQPDWEIPQAATAHDTFWDFVAEHTEAVHHVMWAMSDRGLPRSFRTMEGFGVHTFRLVNTDGASVLAKFHWKPLAGVHSLVWEEAQIAAGVDPDFHRRDLADGIAAGAYFEWELGLQIMPDTDDQTFEGIDLLDPTKIVPEELAPVQPVGLLTLNRNPDNFFAETEQVAFHVGNLVPGIEVTDDPLMQARLFSYLDTQLTRLGGPNFPQLPINCPHVPVNDNLRDGMHQMAVHTGITPYRPNGLDDDLPASADPDHGGYVHSPHRVEGSKVRASPVSFADHYSQASLFVASLSEIERMHVIEAFTFELGKCTVVDVRERVLAALANVNTDVCTRVAAALGLIPPIGNPPATVTPSPALSQVSLEPGPIVGRIIGVIAGPGADLAGISSLRDALAEQKATLRVIAPIGGSLNSGDLTEIVERTFATARSIEFDAIVVADGAGRLADPKLTVMLQEAYRHAKVLGGWGEGPEALRTAGIDVTGPGIVTGADIAPDLIQAVGLHRFWDRLLPG